jgi:ABC-2 type transport system permease protein
MYASLFAIIGAISNENTDTQKYSFILTMPLVITLIYVIEHLQNSNSIMVFLSYFPITSPIALMARLSSGINVIEIILSLLILLISMFVCIKLSSSIYRNAIIADTEKVTIEKLLKWLNLGHKLLA